MTRFCFVIIAVGIALTSLQGCGSSTGNNGNATASSTTGTLFWPSVTLQ